MTLLEKLGFVMWVCSYLFESIADHQKLQFIIEKVKKEGDRTAVCNVGLWKYSRHPNYFGEWMVWNSLIVMSLSSVHNLGLTMIQNLQIYYILANLSILMFYCL